MAVKNYYFNNQQVTQILKETAAALEVKGENRFRIRAYERAATAVEHATVEVKDLWDEDKLTTLSGIGSNIAQHLSQLFEKGQVSHFKELKKTFLRQCLNSWKFRELGPKLPLN